MTEWYEDGTVVSTTKRDHDLRAIQVTFVCLWSSTPGVAYSQESVSHAEIIGLKGRRVQVESMNQKACP